MSLNRYTIKNFFRFLGRKRPTTEELRIRYPELSDYLSQKDYAPRKARHEYTFGMMLCSKAESDEVRSDLADYLSKVDKSFREKLFNLIDQKAMTDAECYKKAHLDRRAFSKIRSNKEYHPKKVTAVAFCLALSLTLPEAEAFLKSAGFSLSDSDVSDKIVKYCLNNQIYDVDTVNEYLYAYDQALIGD